MLEGVVIRDTGKYMYMRMPVTELELSPIVKPGIYLLIPLPGLENCHIVKPGKY